MDMNRRTTTRIGDEAGSTLVAALSTIAILSLVGAGVLMNATTRYNATGTQVKGWKEALVAAESGGDMAFEVLRRNVGKPQDAFNAASGWTSPAPAPITNPDSWSLGYDDASPMVFGEDSRLRARVTVDKFQAVPGSNTAGYYRIRSTGTAQLTGLKRVGMDNRTNMVAKGDNLLRKIDFNFQHFKTTYGYGDALPEATPNATNGKSGAPSPVTSSDKPEVSRRIELVAVPVMPIEGAVRTAQRLRASGASFDSYNSANGPYPGSSNPPPPYDVDAHDADAVCGSSDFDAGFIYGDITTDGGAAKTSQASGVVDNNVPSDVPPATPGVPPLPPAIYLPPSGSTPGYVSGTPSTIDPAPTPYPSTHPKYGQYPTEFWYSYSNLSDVTINPVKATVNGVANTPIDTTVNIYVSGDVRGVKIAKGVSANIYFRGNMDGQARDFLNYNADGPGGNGVYVPKWIADTTTPGKWILDPMTPYTLSPLVSRAGHMWFYGITPADGSTRTIDIAPPKDANAFYGGIYAPGHDFTTRGNPDFYGCFVVKSFYTNGNNEFHFDKQMAANTDPLDYKIASYIEDIR
jgi:hypothetical protein